MFMYKPSQISKLMPFPHLPLQRRLSALSGLHAVSYTQDFTLWPNFLSLPEQRTLLRAALRKLDQTDSSQTRRRRKAYASIQSVTSNQSLQDLFFPDHFYDFQKVLSGLFSIEILPSLTQVHRLGSL